MTIIDSCFLFLFVIQSSSQYRTRSKNNYMPHCLITKKSWIFHNKNAVFLYGIGSEGTFSVGGKEVRKKGKCSSSSIYPHYWKFIISPCWWEISPPFFIRFLSFSFKFSSELSSPPQKKCLSVIILLLVGIFHPFHNPLHEWHNLCGFYEWISVFFHTLSYHLHLS